ncbi:hypothetical protein U0070_016098 [Myodes glareolus]|uniref:Uncharacterized protein n=1 Tax=Myodes glareolus TaxID=447135 RepID=A0AAW0IDJ4_MYOGA
MQQNSSVTEFILLGLTQGPLKAENGVCNLLNFLHGYCVKFSRTLRSPMYFFLFYLSFADSCFSTSTAPRLIVDAISKKSIIS